MFRRHKGGAFKYHFSVHVHSVKLRDGVPAPAGTHYTVLWKRGDKVASTRDMAAQEGRIACDETLSLVCTMYRDPAERGAATFAPKEATFSLLHAKDGKPLASAKQLGRAKVNLAQFASLEPRSEELELVLLHDGVPLGEMQTVISSRWLRNFTRRASTGGTTLSDSSDASSVSSHSSASSGWPTAGETDYSDLGSEAADSDAGSDVGELSYQLSGLTDLADPDTDEELEAVRAAEAAGPSAASAVASAAPAAARLTASMPKLRFGGGMGLGGGKDRRAALAAAEARVASLEGELERQQMAGLEAAEEAERAEEELAAAQAEERSASEGALAAKALADSLRQEGARLRSELDECTGQLAATRGELHTSRDALEATRSALACMEAAAVEAAEAAAARGKASAEDAEALAASDAEARAAAARAEASLAASVAAHAATSDALAGAEVAAASASKERAALASEVRRLSEAEAQLREVEMGELRPRLTQLVEAERRAVEALEQARRAAYEEAAERAVAELSSLLRHAAAARRSGGVGPASTLAGERFSAGMAANEAGEFASARAAFEEAFVAQPRVSLLLSIANMARKLGRRHFAAAAYRYASGDRAQLGDVEGLPLGAASEREAEMAQRKCAEVTMEIEAARPPERAAAEGGGEGGVGGGEGGGEGSVDVDATLRSTQAELLHARREVELLRSEATRLKARHEKVSGEKPSEQLAVMAAELKRCKAEVAEALGEKAALAKQLLEMQRLQRRAKAQRVADRAKATALEVKLHTAREGLSSPTAQAKGSGRRAEGGAAAAGAGTTEATEATEAAEAEGSASSPPPAVGASAGGESGGESEEQQRIREVLQAQAEQIMTLANEKNELQAKLAASAAKLMAASPGGSR